MHPPAPQHCSPGGLHTTNLLGGGGRGHQDARHLEARPVQLVDVQAHDAPHADQAQDEGGAGGGG